MTCHGDAVWRRKASTSCAVLKRRRSGEAIRCIARSAQDAARWPNSPAGRHVDATEAAQLCQQIRSLGGGNFSPIDGIPLGCHEGFTLAASGARAKCEQRIGWHGSCIRLSPISYGRADGSSGKRSGRSLSTPPSAPRRCESSPHTRRGRAIARGAPAEGFGLGWPGSPRRRLLGRGRPGSFPAREST